MTSSSPDQAEPTWDAANLFPHQGAWSEEEYLDLDSNRLVEFSHGSLEIVPMPTQSHQLIMLYCYGVLLAHGQARRLGTVLVAPLRVQLWPGKFREPDVVFMAAEHAQRRGEQYWDGADLVMEVVSEDDRRRDLETKRREYAQAGIPEYWIIDPERSRVVVLTLAGSRYRVHGEFTPGSRASSVLLPGLALEVSAVFAAAQTE